MDSKEELLTDKNKLSSKHSIKYKIKKIRDDINQKDLEKIHT